METHRRYNLQFLLFIRCFCAIFVAEYNHSGSIAVREKLLADVEKNSKIGDLMHSKKLLLERFEARKIGGKETKEHRYDSECVNFRSILYGRDWEIGYMDLNSCIREQFYY